MAHLMMDPTAVVSFIDPSRSATPLRTSAIAGHEVAFSSMQGLDDALIVHGDTQAFLNTLTLNDKIYRLRVAEGLVA